MPIFNGRVSNDVGDESTFIFGSAIYVVGLCYLRVIITPTEFVDVLSSPVV